MGLENYRILVSPVPPILQRIGSTLAQYSTNSVNFVEGWVQDQQKIGGGQDQPKYGRPMEDLIFFHLTLATCFTEFEKPHLYFRNKVAAGMLEQFIECLVECKSSEKKTYVDGTIVHLARLDAWISCVLLSMDAKAGREGQRQMVF